MEAFGIFEGGGMKGLAHVGALHAAEERGIEFKGVAGASAGAILAALIACGYRSEALFDPDAPADESKVFGVDPTRFFGYQWEDFKDAVKDLDKLTKASNGLSAWLRLGWLRYKHSDLVLQLQKDQGIFDTATFERFLNYWLARRLVAIGVLKSAPASDKDKPTHEQVVRFVHVPLPLKIVATDVSRKCLLEFSVQRTPNMAVCEAVAASINLPFVFKPKSVALPLDMQVNGLSTVKAIDGGLLSNFPAWLFDAERSVMGPLVPTFGFRLVEPGKPAADSSELTAFAKDLFRTVLWGDPLLETRQIENIHEIPLAVSVDTLDFDLSPGKRTELFNEGYSSASRHLDRPGLPREPAAVEEVLKAVVDTVRAAFDVPSETLIRANLICKNTHGNLRVTYSFNMNSSADTDDQLEFPLGSGACSRSWRDGTVVVCDLEQAKTDFEGTWHMSKYQQALVRPDMKALLCYPLFSDSARASAPNSAFIEPIAVLNLDSSDRLMYDYFRREDDIDLIVQSVANRLSALLTESALVGAGHA